MPYRGALGRQLEDTWMALRIRSMSVPLVGRVALAQNENGALRVRSNRESAGCQTRNLVGNFRDVLALNSGVGPFTKARQP